MDMDKGQGTDWKIHLQLSICRVSSATWPTSSAGSEVAAEAELGPRQQPRQCAVVVVEAAAAVTAAPTTPSAASSSWCPGAWGALERDMSHVTRDNT